jgi:precorrin-2 C20-methyltransferase
MKGTFYAVGVGPGDPELITVKAQRILALCSVVAVPVSGSARNIASAAAGNSLNGKKILHYDFPMTNDVQTLMKSHEDTADAIAELLDEGMDTAFITIGDPSIYSTAMYIYDILAARGYKVQMIPGVPSFCGAAASLGIPLCLGDEQVCIIPASCGDETERESYVTKIFMKPGKSASENKDGFLKTGAMIVADATMETEKIYRNGDENTVNPGYLSIMIMKEKRRMME